MPPVTSLVSSPDELLVDLNPPQREAVLAPEGPLLVLAGAGSGKTRVITRRVAHLVLARRVQPWRILAVTFTNKAAREMRERLFGMLGPWASDLTVSTFHASAAAILRREAEKVGLTRSFVIYDDADQLSVVKRAMREERIDPVINPREVLHRIDVEKNAGRLPAVEAVDPSDYRGLAVQRAYRAYQRLLRAANAVDFGDLLLLLVQLFRENEETRAHYAGRFLHVLVDEFQDTNAVQMELLHQLAPPPSANLVVVGDDDQSIYRWRGADVGNILRFPEEYTGATIVKLEQNYRSDQIILDAANAVISKNEHRMPKRLWTERQRGEPLALVISRDEREEAHEVARRIHALVREGACGYADVAVFFRVNAQSRVLEEALRLARVPYTLVSGRSFYERAEVKDAASYLRLMVNPKSDADLLRVINTPARAIGDTTQERLAAWAADEGVSLFEGLAAVERIDRGRQARGLAREPGQHEAAAARGHYLREIIAGVAGRPVALEDHVDAVRLEALDPAREARRLVEQRRAVDPAHKGDRQPHRARMRERGAAVRQRALGVLERQHARACDVFLLQVHQHQGRNDRRIDVGAQIDDGAHALALSGC